MSAQDQLFHPVLPLPEPVRAARYDRLVGVDHIKARLRKEATLLASPAVLEDWARKHHLKDLPALTLLKDRAPLLLFSGDVGSGKSALAESFGCDLSDQLHLPVSLYRLRLSPDPPLILSGVGRTHARVRLRLEVAAEQG